MFLWVQFLNIKQQHVRNQLLFTYLFSYFKCFATEGYSIVIAQGALTNNNFLKLYILLYLNTLL